mmetsp:Transcript_13627/g.28806  ORF Transcript_13627/g.28806 Transcript_13627/m.28806 type:complete len:102 (-) Transcript_13627:254-559(-)
MVTEVHKTIAMTLPQALAPHDARAKHLMQRVKTKGLREPLEAVQTILNQNRNLAYEISVNQRMPTIESLTHSNLLIQHYDGNLKQIVGIYKQMGEEAQKML